MHILIVDDDTLSGELTAAVLEDDGHRCRLAENAMEAIEALGSDASIELVISDLNMPLMDGLELFQTLREDGHRQPFVLLTGDDAGPLLAANPDLDAVLTKDATLVDRLAAAVAALAATGTPSCP